MEKIVEISTILIFYCNPSLCKELWVKRLVYMVRLSVTSQQSFLFFNLAMLKIARKLMDFFKKRKINWNYIRKKSQIFLIFCWKNKQICPQKNAYNP